MHLEGLPRRDLFRAARAQLEAVCGERTLAGDLGMLADRDPGDGATVDVILRPGTTFWVQDGDCMHALNLGVNGVGRLHDNDVVIRDECVSRRHCAIVVHRDGTCQIHDVASKNGTILNGKRINGTTGLRDGDSIDLCSRKLVFRACQPSTTAASA